MNNLDPSLSGSALFDLAAEQLREACATQDGIPLDLGQAIEEWPAKFGTRILVHLDTSVEPPVIIERWHEFTEQRVLHGIRTTTYTVDRQSDEVVITAEDDKSTKPQRSWRGEDTHEDVYNLALTIGRACCIVHWDFRADEEPKYHHDD